MFGLGVGFGAWVARGVSACEAAEIAHAAPPPASSSAAAATPTVILRLRSIRARAAVLAAGASVVFIATILSCDGVH
jgi:hypothetical protein